MLYLIHIICTALLLTSEDVENYPSSYLAAFIASHGKLQNLNDNVKGMEEFRASIDKTNVENVLISANWECLVLQSLEKFINNNEAIVGFEMNDLPENMEENVDPANNEQLMRLMMDNHEDNDRNHNSKFSLSSFFPCCKDCCDG